MSAYLWLIISAVLITIAVVSILAALMCLHGDQDVKFDLLSSEDEDEKEVAKKEKANHDDGDKSKP